MNSGVLVCYMGYAVMLCGCEILFLYCEVTL